MIFSNDKCFHLKTKHETYLVYSDIPVKYGEKLELEGDVKSFDTARNPGNFDAKSYYRSIGLYAELRDAKLIKRQRASFVDSLIYKARTAFKNSFKTIDQKYAGIYNAVFTGDKTELDKEQKDLYKAAGISHILVISGLHVGLIGIGIYRGLKKRGLNFLPCAAVSILFIIIYAIFCGNSMSVQRASIMLILFIISEVIKRDYDFLNAISLASFFIVIKNPYAVTNTGFLLSFLSVIAIGIICPITEKVLNLRKKIFIKSLMTACIITLFNMPLIAYNYFYIPTYQIILNILLVPLMGLALIGIILGGGLGILNAFLGRFLIGVSHIFFEFCDLMSELSLTLPRSRILTGRPSLRSIIIYYALFGTIIFICHKDQKFKHKNKLLLLLFLLPFLLFNHNRDKTFISMLDVSQGQCIFINTDQKIMIDCGSSDKENVSAKRIIPYLNCNGINSIDYLFVTHADSDHINGIEALSKEINIKCIVSSEYLKDDKAFRDLIAHTQIPAIYLTEGDEIQQGNLRINCIFPTKSFKNTNPSADSNEMSMCLEIQIEETKLLITGDIGSTSEEYIRKHYKLSDIDILQIPHHGSKYSSSENFLKALSPEISLISCGINNRYGHPHSDVLERLDSLGCDICRTDLDGCITVEIDGDEVEVKRFVGE